MPILRFLALVCLGLASTPAFASVRHVGAGQTYLTIQAAVDASETNDLILVHDGTYHENVVISRRVTLRSRDFAENGENDGAIIDASAAPTSGILVRAAGTVVEGFSVFGAAGEGADGWPAGIAVVDAPGCRVAGNRCGWMWGRRNDLGIALRRADHAVVVGNEIAFGIHGVWVEDSAHGEIRDNDIHDHIFDNSSSGLHLSGQIVKTASTTEGNLLVGNHVHGNNIGVEVEPAVTRTSLHANIFEDGYDGVLVGEWCSHTVIAGNTVRGNIGRGIHLNGAHHATVVGNVIQDNEIGIWLGWVPPVDEGCDYGLVLLNTVTGNGAAGLRISDTADENRVYLNHFAANQPNVEAAAAVWNTPAAVSYFYGGANHGGWLGNSYDTYGGLDLDGDGVGDTGLPFNDGDPVSGPQEDTPLVALPAAFDLQVWFLGAGSPAVMRRGDATQPVCEVTVPAQQYVIWVSDTVADQDLVFAAGAWSGWLRWASSPAPDYVVVQIGTTGDGTGFVPSGALAVLGGGAWDTAFATTAASVLVPAGRRLAVRVGNAGTAACALLTGGGLSAVSSPGLGDPQWPDAGTAAPEADVAALRLGPNRPNPFNPRTEIAFALPAAGRATLRVYDLAGRLVCTLLDTDLPAGPGAVTWDGRDAAGRAAAAGAYICSLTTGGGAPPLMRRMLLVR